MNRSQGFHEVRLSLVSLLQALFSPPIIQFLPANPNSNNTRINNCSYIPLLELGTRWLRTVPPGRRSARRGPHCRAPGGSSKGPKSAAGTAAGSGLAAAGGGVPPRGTASWWPQGWAAGTTPRTHCGVAANYANLLHMSDAD